MADGDAQNPEQPQAIPDEGRIEVRSYFVRERNALLIRSHLGGLYMDYYLHLMQHSVKYETADDLILKNALAALALHVTSKPWHDQAAWTLNLQDPPLNVFVTGDSCKEGLAGRLFSKNVKMADTQRFYSQVNNGKDPVTQSTIEFEGRDIFKAVEQFYKLSEQRPARFFEFAEEDFVMVSAQPECDMEWFNALDADAIRTLDQREELSLLEKRFFRFDCGCTLERIHQVVSPLALQDMDEFFQGEAIVWVDCPRCAARFEVTRSALEAFLG